MSIVRAAHDAIYSRLVFSMREEGLTRALDSVIPAAASVLDVGCGNGLISSRLRELSPDRDFTGIDVAQRKGCMIPCRQYDGAVIPFEDNAFDYVLFVDVLHHTNMAESLLLQSARVARRGVVIKDHYCESRLDYYTLAVMDWVGNAQYAVALPHRYLAAAEWRAMFARLGLRPVRTLERIGLYPGPLDTLFGRNLHFVTLLERLS